MDLDRSCNRFGPVWLAPGVGKSHAAAFLFASVVSIGFMTFINIGQALRPERSSRRPGE